MSDAEETLEKPFYVDRAKTGRAGCKKCKKKIDQGQLRFAKLGRNPFSSGTMKMWHHVPCIVEVFKKQRATTRKIESTDDIGGWLDLSEDDRQEIMSHFLSELKEVFENTATTVKPSPQEANKKETEEKKSIDSEHKDMSFRVFRKLCSDVASASSYNTKTSIISEFLTSGSDGESFKGDIELWCRLLLPGVVKRNYHLQSKQLVKIFSQILGTPQHEMLEHLEKGDVAETISNYFDQSENHQPVKKSVLTMTDVDKFLEDLSTMTKEHEQMQHFTNIIKKCTTNDLKMIIRLVKHDLRINAGAKHILEALHPDAYKAFQTLRDIKAVVENALRAKSNDKKKGKEVSDPGMNIKLKLMTPVLPMLARACTSVEMALKKCPNGMYSEIKYDGERVQVHKAGSEFKYFSRSLKPVMSHKVNHFKEYIPRAFPHGKDLILDGEVLMVDRSGKPLPFGTLGIHKKSEFKDANVCFYVFDCIYYNGESLIDKTIEQRKEILKENMVEIENHVMFSEYEVIHKAEDLKAMIAKVLRMKLEGLVLKDMKSRYEPGKRHWLKMKKDYLLGGKMADTADLVVLGAWFGTGNKGGMMSIFLMGCYDEEGKKWRTVTKVHGGHDDETLERLQSELKMVKISKDPNKVPGWLKCTRTMVPDFVAKDPFAMPVWEITGAEFTRNQVHTADGISIRFPRVTRILKSRDWKTATSLSLLKDLYRVSKETPEDDDDDDDDVDDGPPKKKKKEAKTSDEERVDSDKTETDMTDTDVEEEPPQATSSSTIDNPLPDVFLNCVIQMPKSYGENEFLRRYIIAYGGVVYAAGKNTSVDSNRQKVTHVVHVKRKGSMTKEPHWADNVRHVHVSWLWESIRKLERQKENHYAISCS